MAKILIVDDSAFARNSLRLIVERGSHDVIGQASNGAQAMALFKRLDPELVMLDFLMEDMDGQAVLAEMLAHDPGAKVIMISGSGDRAVGERALRGGAKCFLEKPRASSDLLDVIDQVMGA